MLFSKSKLKIFIEEVENELCLQVEYQKNRFSSWDNLLSKFREPASHLLDSKKYQYSEEVRWRLLKGLIEGHNEVCIAYQILFQQNEPRCIKLEYEPRTCDTEKRIDFHATFNSEKAKWIEVKTIHPDDVKDRAKINEEVETREEIAKIKIKEMNKSEQKNWNQYQRSKQYFPPRTELIISREADGANIWHDKFAARSQMLEYSLEFEKRIYDSLIGANEVCVMVLVGNGYDWRLDELEDFVTFYKTGRHLHGDIFQRMENYHIQLEGRKFSKRIDQFAYFRRPETLIKPDMVIWSMEIPNWPISEQ